jgi:molybdenum cofactor cytidylyltransferase
MLYALILAAGQSRRFGGDKLLAELRGLPVLAHVLRTVGSATSDGVLAGGLVVLAESAEREAIVRRSAMEYCFNADPGHGIAHSIRLGLAELATRHPDARGAMIFQGDQPGVRQEVIAVLASAWGGGSAVVRPRYLEQPEQPGHPVLLDRSVWSHADKLKEDTGFAPLFRKHPELVTQVDVPGANPDINTPSDLAVWESDRA